MVNSPDIPDIRLPMEHIVTGILLFVAAQGSMLTATSHLARGVPQVPSVWAAAHLLILGFGLMIAMGTMYQLIPVALQTQIHRLQMGHWQFGIYTLGVLGLWWSFFQFATGWLVFFAILAVLGVLLFQYNMWQSIRGVKSSVILFAVRYALFYLSLTVLLGLWMAIDFLYPHLGIWHNRLLYTHILTGTIGFFTLLIMGLSYKLVPMFFLSHGYESGMDRRAVQTVHLGMLLAILGLLSNGKILIGLGIAGMVTGFIFYGFYLRRIHARRMKKSLDLGLRTAMFAWPYIIGMLVIVIFLGLLFSRTLPLTAIVYTVLMCWISLTILGYLYKIVPFLWWTHRYSQVIGAKGVPMLKDMVQEKRGKWIFLSLITFITMYAFIMAVGREGLLTIIQWGVFLTSVVYAMEVLGVLRK